MRLFCVPSPTLGLAGGRGGRAPPPAEVVRGRPPLITPPAPASNVLDALTFLSGERAIAFLVTWVAAFVLWGLLRRGPLWRGAAGGRLAPPPGGPAWGRGGPPSPPRPPGAGGRPRPPPPPSPPRTRRAHRP